MKKDEFCEHVLESYRPVESMIRMVPPDKLDWKPDPTFMSLGQLIHHLTTGMGYELQTVLTGNWPSGGEHLPACSPEEALARLEKDKVALSQLLSTMTEEDFTNRIVSVPWGWESKMERMALRFHEHFTNHKMQLFTYLKLLGVPVNTETLYVG